MPKIEVNSPQMKGLSPEWVDMCDVKPDLQISLGVKFYPKLYPVTWFKNKAARTEQASVIFYSAMSYKMTLKIFVGRKAFSALRTKEAVQLKLKSVIKMKISFLVFNLVFAVRSQVQI